MTRGPDGVLMAVLTPVRGTPAVVSAARPANVRGPRPGPYHRWLPGRLACCPLPPPRRPPTAPPPCSCPPPRSPTSSSSSSLAPGTARPSTSCCAATTARMRGLAYKLMADRHRMDDALQEAYLKAYRALPRFRPGQRLRHLALPHHLQRVHRRAAEAQALAGVHRGSRRPGLGPPGPERVVSAVRDGPRRARRPAGRPAGHRRARRRRGLRPPGGRQDPGRGARHRRLPPPPGPRRAPPHPRGGGAMTGTGPTDGASPSSSPTSSSAPPSSCSRSRRTATTSGRASRPPSTPSRRSRCPVEPVRRVLVADPADGAATDARPVELEPIRSLARRAARLPPHLQRRAGGGGRRRRGRRAASPAPPSSTSGRAPTISSGRPTLDAALETLVSDAQSDGATVTTLSAAARGRVLGGGAGLGRRPRRTATPTPPGRRWATRRRRTSARRPSSRR